MTLSRLALAFSLIPATQAFADQLGRESALKLDNVLISANRQVEQRDTSSAANTVFTRADIERLQPSSVTDLLSRVPGVQVAPSGGRGSLPGIFIRGTKAAQSLVLVDGQRIANATSADSNLQYLDVEQIERVEVLRGSRSVIYGADAIGDGAPSKAFRHACIRVSAIEARSSRASACRAAISRRTSTSAPAWIKRQA
jgi:vitamin B12 transporter